MQRSVQWPPNICKTTCSSMAAEVKTQLAGSPHLQPWSIQTITLLTFRRRWGLTGYIPLLPIYWGAQILLMILVWQRSGMSLSCNRWQGIGNKKKSYLLIKGEWRGLCCLFFSRKWDCLTTTLIMSETTAPTWPNRTADGLLCSQSSSLEMKG